MINKKMIENKDGVSILQARNLHSHEARNINNNYNAKDIIKLNKRLITEFSVINHEKSRAKSVRPSVAKRKRGNYNLSNSIVNVNKLVLLPILFIFVIVIFIQNILAIGITPGRTTINFEPGLHQDISFSILNTEHKEMGVVFVVRGDLNESITLTKAFAEFSSSEESKQFSYSINLPQKIEKPGLYKTEIVAIELPKNIKEEGTFVGATVGVITQLYVYVPYPDKYIEAELNIIAEEEKVNFILPLVNRGKLDVVNAKASIDIYTPLNEKIASLETNSVSVKSLERDEIFAEWIPNVNPGKYLAIATIIYDNKATKVEKEFNVGEALVEILEINVKEFRLGEIAKFDALVENKWSGDFKDSFLNILVFNNEGEIMADFKSPNYDLSALSKSEMIAYWDTAGVREGEYDGKLILKYGERSSERNIRLKIGQNDIEIIGLTGKVLVKGKEGKLNINNLLIIAVIVLVIANVIWFVLIRKLMRKRR